MNTRESLFLFATFLLCSVYAFVGGRGGKKLNVIFFGGIPLTFSILDMRHLWWNALFALSLGSALWFFVQGTTFCLWITLNYGTGFILSASILERISLSALNSNLFYSFSILFGILLALGSIRVWRRCGLQKMKAIFTASFASLTFLSLALFVAKKEGVLIQFFFVLYAMILFMVGYFIQNKEQRVEIV